MSREQGIPPIREVEKGATRDSDNQSRLGNGSDTSDKAIDRAVESFKEHIERVGTKIDERLEFLRDQEFTELHFGEIDTLARDLEGRDYFEQLVILEKAVQDRKLSAEDILKLFKKSRERRTQLAIIENLPYYKDTDDNSKCMEFLQNVATFGCEESFEFSLPGVKVSELEFHYIDGKYRLNREDDEDSEVFTAASLIGLANFGRIAEGRIIEVFQENREEVEAGRARRGKFKERGADDYEEDYEMGMDIVDAYRGDEEFFDYYFYHNSLCLKKLAEIGTRRSIDFAIGFLKKDKDSTDLYKYELIKIFENIDITHSSKKLLTLLKEKDMAVRRRVAKALCALEFGRIGISEQGVRYLEKVYDLQEKNNPNYFVQRLTADGDIGIFDEDRNLDSYFKLDLESEEDVIKPQVMEFVYETLFLPKEGETPEEKAERERILEEFKTNYYQFYEADFFGETGIRFNNLSFPEQAWFLEYTRSHPEWQDKIFDFAKKYGEDGLKTFISLESGQEMGDRILEIGDNLDAPSAIYIFAKYGEIIRLTDINREEIANLFKNRRDITKIEIERIGRSLIDKGSQLLVDFSERIRRGEKADKESILQELERYRTDLILTGSVYKGIDKKEGVSPEELKGVTFEQKPANECSGQEISQMMEIYSENYKYRPTFRDKLLEGFRKVVETQGEKTMIYMYKKDGQVIAFNRFDRIRPGEKYFGSFNVNPIIQCSSIGSALFRASIEREAPGNRVEATCDVFSPASLMYIEKGKFTAVKVMPEFDEETKEPAFFIRRERDGIYRYQDKSMQEIIREYQTPSLNSHIILKSKPKSPELLRKCEELINNQGYVLTRYFATSDRRDVYCVFERIESSS